MTGSTAASTVPAAAWPDRRPKRADARRNYDNLVSAARESFTEHGTAASLEEIARRAGVGIGTLYRNFPTRQDLLEATYLQEVETLCDSAVGFAELPPWDAFAGWLMRFAQYAATKRALMAELLATIGTDSPLFSQCHGAIWSAGEPLLARAQEAGAIRQDVSFGDTVRLISGVAMARFDHPDQIAHLLTVALDGLRYRSS